MKTLQLLLIISVVFVSTIRAQTDTIKAKQLNPADGKALVYILRPTAMAFALRFPVDVNEKPLATLGPKDFGFMNLDPGKNTFKVVNGTSPASIFEIELEAGKTYYLLMEMKMGLVTGRGVLKQIDEKTGKKYLDKCDLADNNQEKP